MVESGPTDVIGVWLDWVERQEIMSGKRFVVTLPNVLHRCWKKYEERSSPPRITERRTHTRLESLSEDYLFRHCHPLKYLIQYSSVTLKVKPVWESLVSETSSGLRCDTCPGTSLGITPWLPRMSSIHSPEPPPKRWKSVQGRLYGERWSTLWDSVLVDRFDERFKDVFDTVLFTRNNIHLVKPH